MLCIPCIVGACDSGQRCTTTTGESIGLPCQCDHGKPKVRVVARPKGVHVVKRPRSVK